MASPRQEQFSQSMLSPQQAQFPQPMLSPQQAQFATPMMSPQYGQFPYGQQMPMSPSQLSHPMAPTPVPNPLSPPLSPREPSRLSKSSPLSFFSSRSRNSTDKKDSFRISVKGLPISNPVGSPKTKDTIIMTETGPASPRVYAPGPPPPTPGYLRSDVSVMPTIPQSAEPSPQPPFPGTASKRGAPAPLTLGTDSTSQLPNGSQKSLGELPLRSYGPTPPQSAPYTRVQFADRRESRINPGPKTGIPYPHSPYMPFSPVTPLSATIRTGKELKAAKKAASRMDQSEMVKSTEDIW